MNRANSDQAWFPFWNVFIDQTHYWSKWQSKWMKFNAADAHRFGLNDLTVPFGFRIEFIE